MLSVDGAPLAKSSVRGLWIISISEPLLDIVKPVGIYHGPNKPKDSSVLMKSTVEELVKLINEGLVVKNKKYEVILDALVCDAPARAYILKVKQHTGYWSCHRCTIKGENINHRQCFPFGASSRRTHEGFVKNLYVDDNLNDGHQQIHKLGETNMKSIPKFDCVNDVVIDYMHLVCLGVMLKLIILWTITFPILSASDKAKISKRLKKVKMFTLSDFARKLRLFENAKRIWKAHELRQFFLYVGPVIWFGI